jgi:predicted dithiol-disulfide oxidoreductase (DUF899 family)
MDHPVANRENWIKARQALLVEEKQLFRAHDALKAKRRTLPWLPVEKDYVFETKGGKKSLAELFDGKSQLVVYHLMYAPQWDSPCEHCSFWADHFDGVRLHIGQRDANLIAISRAPVSQLEAHKKRMGWNFQWASAAGNSFPYDFLASFTDEEVASKSAFFNYVQADPLTTDREGVSVFFKDSDEKIYLTYATFARGIDMLNGTYNYLDLCPKGRDEESLEYPQEWVKFHDEY